MSEVRSEEYRFLRQEHEANRKLVFERPLIIVAATLAAAFGSSERGSLGLPVPFLSLLAFNLWFTYNRLESSSRIIAYIQLVHEGEARLPWLGWETALRHYRKWLFDVQCGITSPPNTDGEVRQFDSMAFYGPIFFFHVLLGIVVTAVLLVRSQALDRLINGAHTLADVASVIGVVSALVIFGAVVTRFRPTRVRDLVELKRRAWIEVFSLIRADVILPGVGGQSPSNPPLQPTSGASEMSILETR